MTSNFSAFMSTVCAAWTENVEYPQDASSVHYFDESFSLGVLTKKVDSLLLDDGDTRTITIQGLALSTTLTLWITVDGECRLETVAKDYDGVTTINGYIPGYGTKNLPGKIILSTYNLSSITIRGLADNTRVEVFVATTEAI